jgi:hypothetical protein
MSENTMLRRIFGLKRDEVIRDWRELHVEELRNLYSPPNNSNDKFQGYELGRACCTHGGEQECMQSFDEGKRPLGRFTRKWEDNIKMDVREIGWDDMDWIGLVQNKENFSCS